MDTSLGALRAHLDRRLGLKTRRRSAIETDAKVLAQAAAMGLLKPSKETIVTDVRHSPNGGNRRAYVGRRGSTAVPDVQTALRLRAMVATDVPSSDLALRVRAGAEPRQSASAPRTIPGSYAGLAAGGIKEGPVDRLRGRQHGLGRTPSLPREHGGPTDKRHPGNTGGPAAATRAMDLSSVADSLLPPTVDLGLRGPLWQDCLYSDYAHRAPLQRLDFSGMAAYMTDPLLSRMLG